MRNAFADELVAVAQRNDKVFLLSGDIGNRLFDRYKEQFPGRFLNCGVAEANMTGVAAGLAMSGFRPITYTITPFLTTRCLEQIRVDVCYHNVPVIIVGVGSGLCYASLGPTHHSCEDISFLRSLPNMKVICPADAHEVRAALHAALQHDGPVYIRLGKKNEPLIHPAVPRLEIGKGVVMQEGTDVCLLSTGNILPVTMDVARRLEANKISTGVINLHTVKPLDEALLAQAFSTYKKIVTLEEHSLIGGLGSSVAEWMADHFPQNAELIRFGTADRFMDVTGGHNFARAHFGLSAENIATKITNKIMNMPDSAGKHIQQSQQIQPAQPAQSTQSTTKPGITAAVLVETAKPLVLAELELPALQPGQVLVEIVYSGVCHTQISECRGRRGEDPYLPHCLGHEGCGIVKEVGEGVTNIQPGDKVIISWMKGAGSNIPGSVYQWPARDNQKVNAGGVTTFQKVAIISENRLTKIQDGVSMQDAALLGCAVATGLGSVFNVAKAKPSDSIAVFGAGRIGLCAIAGAKIAGCDPIIAIDINDAKLLLAKKMGATHCINPNRVDPIADIARIHSSKLDFAIESAGIPSVMDQALQAVKPQGGTVIVIGNAPFGKKWDLDPWELNQGKRILGTWGGDNVPERDFPKYMELLASGTLNLSLLTTKVYPLQEINTALADLEQGRVACPLIDMNLI